MFRTRRRVPLTLSAAALALFVAPVAFAQEIRPIPPTGIVVPEADRAALMAEVEALGREIETLREALKRKPELSRFLPDVQIYYNAVRYPLLYNEFYNVKELTTAKDLLAQGRERAKSLREGNAPWAKQTGTLALGYVSKIDGSVQPYALVVPETFTEGDKKPRRLDFFCHGRGETLTELNFIAERQRSPGEFTPPDTFVLHPYGRYCNANRFAGEVDLFEALDDAKKRYPVDENRLVMRGFSMGGASAWQYATHFPDMWAAAAPGAGFSEASGFLRLFAEGKTPPPWYEQKLFRWYDATDYAANLYNCPTVAYNGDRDGQ
ncbi:MAG: prolyl oligopeptidase family serine peptidase, partial [Fibrella sp.]|nr:prolyl oligopeptidase family serine peptidase [Armatimonadota bacterium]